jgi:hypothetical protein
MRILSQIVIVSVSLNVGLLTSLIYVVAEKKLGANILTQIPKQTVVSSLTNAQMIKIFFSYSYQELLTELFNNELIEYGYTRRDLALACLVQFHYFDLEKALPNIQIQKREMEFIYQDGGEVVKLTVYPGMRDSDFMNVIALAEKEEWPLTPEGLFYELQKMGKNGSSTSLQEAFFSSHEFYIIYTLFIRCFEEINQEEVLSILIDGEWQSITDFVFQVQSVMDLSIHNLRMFLLPYISSSSHALNFWIHHDSEYLLKKLDDKLLYELIRTVREKDLQTTLFLKQIICSSRSDGVRKAAGVKLYEFASEVVPDPYDHESCIKKFLPSFFSTPVVHLDLPRAPFEKIKPVVRKHVVKEGESLWKIARRYQVDFDILVEVNQLDPDRSLSIGRELIIP